MAHAEPRVTAALEILLGAAGPEDEEVGKVSARLGWNGPVKRRMEPRERGLVQLHLVVEGVRNGRYRRLAAQRLVEGLCHLSTFAMARSSAPYLIEEYAAP